MLSAPKNIPEKKVNVDHSSALFTVGGLLFLIVLATFILSGTAKQETPKNENEQAMSGEQTVDIMLERMTKLDGKHSKEAFQSLLNIISGYYPDVPSYKIAAFLFHTFYELWKKVPDASLYDFVLEVKNTARDARGVGVDNLIRIIATVADSKMRGY